MVFWICMMLMLLVIPTTMIIIGKYFGKLAPKEINTRFGYRTPMSMKNSETWQFAQTYFAKVWHNIGRVLLLSVLLMFFVIGKGKDTIAVFATIVIIIQLIPLLSAILLTEKALKKKFDINGNCIR